jgi:hypothetical protein
MRHRSRIARELEDSRIDLEGRIADEEWKAYRLGIGGRDARVTFGVSPDKPPARAATTSAWFCGR